MATQAERDSYNFLQQQTATRVAQSCAGELEREVDEILGPIGVPAELSRQVANKLQDEEMHAMGSGDASLDVQSQAFLENGQPLSRLKFQSTVGLTPFLLQFGQGLHPVPRSRMYSSAATIGLGYLVGGAIPLLPYFFLRAFIYRITLPPVFTYAVSLSLSHCLGGTFRFMYSYVPCPRRIWCPQGPYHRGREW